MVFTTLKLIQKLGKRRRSRQKKRWEDNTREWTGLEFAESQGAVEKRGKWRDTGCEVVYGACAPTTFTVKG